MLFLFSVRKFDKEWLKIGRLSYGIGLISRLQKSIRLSVAIVRIVAESSVKIREWTIGAWILIDFWRILVCYLNMKSLSAYIYTCMYVHTYVYICDKIAYYTYIFVYI